MIKIKIKAKTVKVPSSFEELSISQVQAIYFILGGRDSLKDLSINKQRQIMMILFDKDRDIVQYVQDKSIKLFFDTYNILDIQDGIVTDIFKVGGHRYTMVDLDSLNVKQFNELDHLLVNTTTPFQYADEIARLVLRKVEGGIYLNPPTRKAYKQGVHYGKKKLTTISIEEFEMIKSSIPFIRYYAIFCKVVEWRMSLYDKYKVLKPEVSEAEEADDAQFGEVKDDRAQIFGNYHTLMSICETPTDLFKWEQQNIHDYFVYLCYLKISTDIENSKNTLNRNSINK